MAVAPLVYQVLAEQEKLSVSFNIPALTSAALHIAFYTAMLEANADDPMDDAEDDAEIVQFMKDQRKTFLDVYMTIINEEV